MHLTGSSTYSAGYLGCCAARSGLGFGMRCFQVSDCSQVQASLCGSSVILGTLRYTSCHNAPYLFSPFLHFSIPNLAATLETCRMLMAFYSWIYLLEDSLSLNILSDPWKNYYQSFVSVKEVNFVNYLAWTRASILFSSSYLILIKNLSLQILPSMRAAY